MADKTIRENFFDAKAVGALWDVAVSLKRGNPLPIDADSVFQSEAKLVEYIGDKITTVAYPGQIVAVVNENSTDIYYIDQNLDYHAVGSKLTADGSSIMVNNDVISLAGFDTADDGLLAQVKVDAEGNRTLNWVSIETIAEGDGNTTYTFTGLDSTSNVSFDVKASDSDRAVQIYLDAYSRGEIDTKITEIEGKIATAKAEAIEAATYDDTQIVNRVTTIETDYAKKTDLPNVPEKLSEFTNDTGYQTASQVETIVDTAIAEINHAVFEKVDAVPAPEDAVANVLYLVPNGDKLDIYALISGKMVLIDDTDADLSGYATDDELQAVLDRVVELEGMPHLTTDNVNGLIDNKLVNYDVASVVESKIATAKQEAITEATYDDTQLTTDVEGLKTSVENVVKALNDKANSGTTLAEYGITDAYTKTETDSKIQEVANDLSDVSETAADVAQSFETYKTANDARVLDVETDVADIFEQLEAIEAGAQVNKIEKITLNDVELAITDKVVDIPAATATSYGVVKPGAEFQFNTQDGSLEIKELDARKLVGTLVLNGGTAGDIIEQTSNL